MVRKSTANSAQDSVTPEQVLRRFRVVFNAVRTHFRQMEKQVGLGGGAGLGVEHNQIKSWYRSGWDRTTHANPSIDRQQPN